MALHRAPGDAHCGGYLGLGKAGVVTQHDRLPLSAGQFAERGDERGALQPRQGAMLGVGLVDRRLGRVLVHDPAVPQHRT
jgi:hypothetical protein